MNNKIDVVQVEQSEDEKKVALLSETYWKDYLSEQDYIKDPKKMCEVCIADQINKHGKQVIPCTGINRAENALGETLYKELISTLTEEEIKELDALYDPYVYMETYLDIGKPKQLEDRWYQKMISACSSKSKVIRVGRRSGKTYMMALMMVQEMILNSGYRVLLISPYAVQTAEVIKTFRDLCSRLPENPIKSAKQTPAWEINFHNGSVLMGFTAATNADSVRGQTADRIVFDEYDDIPVDAITSVMAIKMSVPDVKVWRSGTPKGERNLHKAEQDPMNKCFHYPSYVIPHYTDEMDTSLRAEMGDGIGYIQEVLAIIGVANNQVFQSMFLNRAQNKTYKVTALDVINDRQRFILFLGVDWNHDKVGSRLISIAYDKINPQFYIIDKDLVAIEGFTQHAAQDRIITLNRKYNYEHIFVDQGFGVTQVANLKQFAMAQVGIVPKGHPDLKLLDIQPIDYGSYTEVLDSVTGLTTKTPTKQMAVMNMAEVLEKDLITLDPIEDADIVKQFKNYVEKSRNKNRITYGCVSSKIGDHDLDAIMIGLFGMKKTYSTIFGNYSTDALLTYISKKEEETNEVEELDTFTGLSFGSRSKNRSRISGFEKRDRSSGRRNGRLNF